MTIQDKTIVVTGAGNGVGRELALQLLAHGANVACVDINAAGLAETLRIAEAYKERISVFEADITDSGAIEKIAGLIAERFGAIDALINNAGIIHSFLHVDDMNAAAIEKVMRVNFFGTLNMIKAFLPYLRMRQSSYIVNLSSAGALAPIPGETAYGASKAAVRLLTEGLRYELRETGVRVMAVFPGGINTNIIQNSDVHVASSIDQLRARLAFLLLSPQKVARKILLGMKRNRTRLVLGIDAVIMDVFCRISPTVAPRFLYRVIDTILAPHVKTGEPAAEK
jgi:short-subunit dehydrogenase